MLFSSEKVSNKFLQINHSAIMDMKSRDFVTLRERGRVDYYIMYILRGGCTVVENGTELLCGVGDLILYRPHERQEYRFLGQDHTIYIYVHFSGTACEEILSELGLGGERVMHPGESAQLERLLREVASQCNLRRLYWEITASALLLQFLAAAAHKIASDNTPWTPALDRVIQHMHEHFEQNRSVAFYADMCHLSVSRFAHLFKQAVGESPGQYLTKLKVEAACKLLCTTTLSVTDVAYTVGIEDLNYFGRVIKKQTGKTPSQWR